MSESNMNNSVSNPKLGIGDRLRDSSLPAYAAFVVLILLLPRLAGNNYYLGVLNQIGIFAIVAVGLNLLMGYAGQISLGHAGFYGLGAYTSAYIAVHMQLSPWLGLPAAIVICGFAAFIVGIPTLKLKGHYLALATLGMGIILFTLFMQLKSITGGSDGMVSFQIAQATGMNTIPKYRIGEFVFNTETRQMYLIWGILLLVIVISNNIVNSRFGRALRALHTSEGAADVLGVNTARYKLIIFVLSAMYAGVAGALYAHYASYMSPYVFDLLTSVKFVVMVVVGGMASIWGSIIGVALLRILPQALTVFEDYDVVIYGGLLVMVLIFLPQGLMKGIGDIWAGMRFKRKPGAVDSAKAGSD